MFSYLPAALVLVGPCPCPGTRQISAFAPPLPPHTKSKVGNFQMWSFPDLVISRSGHFQIVRGGGDVANAEVESNAEISRSGNSRVFRRAAGSPLESSLWCVMLKVSDKLSACVSSKVRTSISVCRSVDLDERVVFRRSAVHDGVQRRGPVQGAAVHLLPVPSDVQLGERCVTHRRHQTQAQLHGTDGRTHTHTHTHTHTRTPSAPPMTTHPGSWRCATQPACVQSSTFLQDGYWIVTSDKQTSVWS